MFMKRKGKALEEGGILSNKKVEEIKKMVQTKEKKEALIVIKTRDITDQYLNKWKSGSELNPKSGPLLSKEVLKEAEKAIKIKTQINKIKRDSATAQKQIDKIFSNQSRLRENIKLLSTAMPKSDLMTRYLKDLDKEEDEVKQARKNIAQHQEDILKLEKQLAEAKADAVRKAGEILEVTKNEQIIIVFDLI